MRPQAPGAWFGVPNAPVAQGGVEPNAPWQVGVLFGVPNSAPGLLFGESNAPLGRGAFCLVCQIQPTGVLFGGPNEPLGKTTI